VETPGGHVVLSILERSPVRIMVSVDMGVASFRSSDVGLKGPDREVSGELLQLSAGDRLEINTVSLGNPHCVIFEDEVDPETLRRRAPQVSTHPWFERGTNVQFARVVGPAAVEAWIWERGAGETLASGSSACAVAAVAVRRGLLAEKTVEVRMPGGTLQVEVREDWTIVQQGPAEAVFRGELTEELLRRLKELA
jgi:diaminopimelate epimerase